MPGGYPPLDQGTIWGREAVGVLLEAVGQGLAEPVGEREDEEPYPPSSGVPNLCAAHAREAGESGNGEKVRTSGREVSPPEGELRGPRDLRPPRRCGGRGRLPTVHFKGRRLHQRFHSAIPPPVRSANRLRK